jgi:hypothetical protein
MRKITRKWLIHIVSPRESPAYMDHEGNEVKENERFGLEQELKIKHPHNILLQMIVGIKQTRIRVEMMAIESISLNIVLHPQSSVALWTIGSQFTLYFGFGRTCLLHAHCPAQRRNSHDMEDKN